MHTLSSLLLTLAGLTLNDPSTRQEFVDYWYQGKAEISRYELSQVRYGESHPGDAVLVFVTEDFLPEKQVKSDSSNRARSGAWPILKLNFNRKFNTGIYPYSGMTSVFTPVQIDRNPRTLKMTTTLQEWCGHTFTQLNLRGEEYQATTFSYFESEGDREFGLPAAWLEDELWTRIRLDPQSLPVGRFEVIPGGIEQRFSHRSFRAEPAQGTLKEGKDGRMVYTVRYEEMRRELAIEFEKAFPYRIEGWTERYGAPGSEGRSVATVAKRTHTLVDAYWNHNSRRDAGLRTKLGLE